MVLLPSSTNLSFSAHYVLTLDQEREREREALNTI
jgi:hypothetical protein